MTISEQTNITVIIPVYNCREYLAEAVSSVLRQPYQRIQIVLIDDGSTDGSGQICDELGLKNSRITVLHQKMPECQRQETLVSYMRFKMRHLWSGSIILHFLTQTIAGRKNSLIMLL